MAELVSDALWKQIEPLLPPLPPPSPKGGRPPVPHREALAGIIFVLRTGIPWQALPAELNCGSGSTCWRRFSEWTRLSVWSKLHALLLTTLGKAGAVNLDPFREATALARDGDAAYKSGRFVSAARQMLQARDRFARAARIVVR